MTDPTPLSPAAQAVLDATGMQGTPQEIVARGIAAAALRAAVDRVVPSDPCGNSCCIAEWEQIRADFRAIAAELDPTTETTND